MNDKTTTHEITAVVVRGKEQPFVIEQARLRGPQDDEVLVKVVATGLCHTDLIVRDQYYPVPLPAVLGHEGLASLRRWARTCATSRWATMWC